LKTPGRKKLSSGLWFWASEVQGQHRRAPEAPVVWSIEFVKKGK